MHNQLAPYSEPKTRPKRIARPVCKPPLARIGKTDHRLTRLPGYQDSNIQKTWTSSGPTTPQTSNQKGREVLHSTQLMNPPNRPPSPTLPSHHGSLLQRPPPQTLYRRYFSSPGPFPPPKGSSQTALPPPPKAHRPTHPPPMLKTCITSTVKQPKQTPSPTTSFFCTQVAALADPVPCLSGEVTPSRKTWPQPRWHYSRPWLPVPRERFQDTLRHRPQVTSPPQNQPPSRKQRSPLQTSLLLVLPPQLFTSVRGLPPPRISPNSKLPYP